MPWIGINKTIRKTVAYIILFKNQTRDILFTQNENKIFFRIFPFFYLSFSNFELLKVALCKNWYFFIKIFFNQFLFYYNILDT
jgi:hypothetical protein